MKLSDDNQQRKNNIKGLFQNPATLKVITVTGVVLAVIVGMAFLRLGKAADEVPSGASVGNAPAVQHQPGVNDTPTHAALQRQANAQRLEQAQRQGQSTLPTLTGAQQVDQPITLPSATTPQNTTQDVSTIQFQPVVAPVVEPTAAPTPVVNAPVAAATPVKPQVSQDKKKQIEATLSYWAPQDLLFQEYTVVNKQEKQWQAPNPQLEGAGQAGTAGINTTASVNANQQASQIRFVRAGTTIPAKLITPLNSDAPGPVLAEITSGPLAGARLIGTMSVAKNSLLVNFTTISKPGWPNTYQVQAVGMSVDKSTALATDVNNHYVQKYFGLLAGSFIQGYGDAMSQQGSVTYLDPVSGGVVTSRDELSGSQIAKSAQGEVLSRLGQDWQRQTKKVTPTIKVQGKDGAEYPLQVLFLRNF